MFSKLPSLDVSSTTVVIDDPTQPDEKEVTEKSKSIDSPTTARRHDESHKDGEDPEEDSDGEEWDRHVALSETITEQGESECYLRGRDE